MEQALHLTFWGSFQNSALESGYQEAILKGNKRSLHPVLIVLACTFALFLFPDIMANRGNPLLGRILVLRIGVILWLAFLVPLVRHAGTPGRMTVLMTASQVIVGVSFLYVSSLYLVPSFTMQLLTFTLMSLSFFVLPCGLLHTTLSTGLLWALFLGIASFRFPHASSQEWLAAILFPVLFILVALSFRLRIEREQRRMHLLHLQLEQMSEQDPLTGAANRYRFTRDLSFLLADAKAGKRVFSVLLMDVDWFKAVNDQYGHQAGDAVLTGVCDLFRHHLRHDDLLVRWGGEEFAAILPDTGLEEAAAVAERVRGSLADARFTQKGICMSKPMSAESNAARPDSIATDMNFHGIAITGSFGVACVRPDDTEKTIMGRADRLMYLAKAMGRNRVIWKVESEECDISEEQAI